MSMPMMTLEQIRLVGLEALIYKLGPVGMIRFLQQFETGRGDYSVERQQWLGNPDVQTLGGRIEQYQKEAEN